MFEILSSEEAFRCPFFVITKYGCVDENKKHHDYYVHEAPDSSHILCLTKEGKLVLVREYYLPTRETSLHFPGGTIEKGETAMEAAVRELKEETGLKVPAMKHLYTIAKDPGYSAGRMHVFLAKDAEQESEPENDIVLLTPQEVKEAIDKGEMNCAPCMAAFSRAVDLRI
ncbi:MAG: NUDIX hydrolase [Nanoarchaeota archaeon]|nr:NUDIX hydrolase [Nanoarchaeota archaeon]